MKIEYHDGDPRQRGGDELMSKADVAHWLNVSVGAVDRYRREEDLPFIKAGRRVLFRRRDVEKWLEGRANGGNGSGRPGRGGPRK